MASIQLEQQLAEEKKRAHSLTDVMRKPTRVVLLKVGLFPRCIYCVSLHYEIVQLETRSNRFNTRLFVLV